jgi:hypothetical protein
VKKKKKAKTSAAPKRAWHKASPPASKEEAEAREAWRAFRTGLEEETTFLHLTFEQKNDRGMLAVYDADRTGSDKPIGKLLLSDTPLTEFGRKVLWNWIDRTNRKGKIGKPPTPIYATTTAEWRLHHAMQDVRELVAEGETVPKAIAKVQAERKIPKQILENAYLKKRGSTNRMKKHRP